jgi:hypothetical protein
MMTMLLTLYRELCVLPGPAAGVISLSRSLNYEADPVVYTITVMVTDTGSPPLSATKVVTVSLLNVNDAPVRASATGLPLSLA